MDQHTSYVTLASDENWDKPVNETSGGYGRSSFMSHFDLLTNQHGYFSKNDEVYVQARVDIFATHNCIIPFGGILYTPRLSLGIYLSHYKNGKMVQVKKIVFHKI